MLKISDELTIKKIDVELMFLSETNKKEILEMIMSLNPDLRTDYLNKLLNAYNKLKSNLEDEKNLKKFDFKLQLVSNFN